MKIIFLGDSLIRGGYGGNLVAEVAHRLPDHTVINAGEGGDTIVNLFNRIEKALAYDPDAMFVMAGGNDAISYTQPETRFYYHQTHHVPGGMVTPTIFAQAYRGLLSRLQEEYIQTWVGLPPMEYNPEIVTAMREFNAIAADIAASLDIPILDLMAHFTPNYIAHRPPIGLDFIKTVGERSSRGWSDYEGEQQRLGFTFSFDGIHLTPQSASRIAELIVDFLDV